MRVVFAFLNNLALLADTALNVLLGGWVGETISHRMGRLRIYGGPRAGKVGCIGCAILTKVFFFMRRDHCDWALEKQEYAGRELWRWSK